MNIFLVVIPISRLTTVIWRHDAHHGENLRFQYQRWENTWSYDKMVRSEQQYCDIHSEGSNATLSTTLVRNVPGTTAMVRGSCPAVNQYCVQATGRGSRLESWANSSPRPNMYTRYVPPNILRFPMLTEWATCVRYLQFGMNVSISWTNRTSSSKAQDKQPPKWKPADTAILKSLACSNRVRVWEHPPQVMLGLSWRLVQSTLHSRKSDGGYKTGN